MVRNGIKEIPGGLDGLEEALRKAAVTKAKVPINGKLASNEALTVSPYGPSVESSPATPLRNVKSVVPKDPES